MNAYSLVRDVMWLRLAEISGDKEVDGRMASVERGEEPAPRPKRPVRGEGWAKPDRSKKFSRKKAKVA